MRGSEQPPPDPSRPSTKAAERLAVIVDAAERAALSVIDDAEQEARRYLEEAQVRADLIVAERLREAADLLEQHRGATVEPLLRPVADDPPVAEAEEAEAPPFADEASEPEASFEPEQERDVRARTPEFEDLDPEDEDPEPEDEPPPATPVSDMAVKKAPPEAPAAPRNSGSAAARLLATQMAVSGSSRKEIEMRLRNGFEIEDTGEILDAILGPEE